MPVELTKSLEFTKKMDNPEENRSWGLKSDVDIEQGQADNNL